MASRTPRTRRATPTPRTSSGAAEAVPPSAVDPTLAVKLAPGKLAQLQADYLQRWKSLYEGLNEGGVPGVHDKRFADPSWQNNGLFTWNAAVYLLNAEFMHKLAEAVEGDDKSRDRVRFAVQQWVDMMSPANYLVTNPEAQKLLVETQGKSLVSGIENMLADMRRGRISQTDETAFEVGRNVATSKGAVVFQNELIQLIQYAPLTDKVATRPILLVPPSINKFYIMDLQPENSLVRFLAEQGHTVFMVSWRNVEADLGQLTWDDYLELGALEAIRVVREISGQQRINALGFCVGGTILATAVAALAARGETPLETLTLMTTLLDFAEPGVLGVFVDERQVRLRESTIGKGGIMPGKDLATTFSFLRPNDLVWNYVVSNYLKGQQPPAFDLLYWNGDSTNLPGPMYCWYLRHMYLQNELRQPDRLVSLGEKIDLRRIKVPAYVLAAREDHIVPWRAAYQSTQLLGGKVRFALGASGHIAGSINPASKNKRSYWLSDSLPPAADQWLADAVEHPGSWWNDWAKWLRPHMGPMVAAPKSPGNRQHRAIEPAPGSYVKHRVV